MQLEFTENNSLSNTNSHSDFSQKSKKYAKITPQIKEKFLKLIIDQNMSIKQASQSLRINYSSAKAILSTHKKSIRCTKKQFNIAKQNSHRSTYRQVRVEEAKIYPNFRIIFSIGGKNQKMIQEVKTKQIFRPAILVQCNRVLKKERQSTDQQN